LRRKRIPPNLALPALLAIGRLCGQTQPDPCLAQPEAQRWNLYFQSTGVGDMHPGFPAQYSGVNSLPDYAEKRASWTGTIFADVRLSDDFDMVINPEISGGRGFGQVTGLAGFPNGEISRVGVTTPTLYLARGYLRYVVPLGGQAETVAAGPNQLAGTQGTDRFTFLAGKFSATDFFDNNTYSHDPRTQFLNWSIMDNSAWDYPADVRGYTVGVYEELTLGPWAIRNATMMEPSVANGPLFDTHVTKNRGEAVEVERHFSLGSHPGAVRTMGFLNRDGGGNFLEALHNAELTGTTPTLDGTRRNGALKYGFGVSVEQELMRDIGLFGRYGWADGKTEAWAFTQVDRSVSGGLAVGGRLWRRPQDHLGAAFARNYLSGDQRAFLAAGGVGFIIGDGALDYAPEQIFETYYSVPLSYGFTASLDYQYFVDPAYNQARGPVSVYSLRIHWEASWRPH
jgi:high affinity Mn2+ porin